MNQRYRSIPRLTPTDTKQFWSKVDRRGPDECWLWTASTNNKGYGHLSTRGGSRLAHRVAFFLETSQQPGTFLVCHTCDTPRCCNPQHLFLATEQGNSDDMTAKGRQNNARGTDASRALLTEEDVALIRQSEAIISALAEEFGVSPSAIESARRGETWKHLPGRGARRILLPEQVKAIRTASRHGESGRSLARHFDVSEGTISMIINWRTWKHVA